MQWWRATTENLGFEPVETAADGATTWRLELSSYTLPNLPMRLEDTALAAPKVVA